MENGAQYTFCDVRLYANRGGVCVSTMYVWVECERVGTERRGWQGARRGGVAHEKKGGGMGVEGRTLTPIGSHPLFFSQISNLHFLYFMLYYYLAIPSDCRYNLDYGIHTRSEL